MISAASSPIPGASPATAPIVEMRGITKSFFGTRVLQDVDFTLWPGEVHALMGENGAGKSTLMKILGGMLRPDAGRILFEGRPFSPANPGEVLRAGIALIHQELNLVPQLTVAENIFLGSELRDRRRLVDRPRMRAEAAGLLAELEAGFAAGTRVADLSVAEQQLVEIARALHHESQVLVMDEPTAALSEREATRLFGLIQRLRARGTAIVYISHRLPEVQAMADRVTVLRDGRLAGNLERGGIETPEIIRLMVGRPLHDFYVRRASHCPERTVLRAQGVGDGRRVKAVDLDVRAGEVVGLAGLVGAGRTEFARLVFGADRATTGRIEFAGEAIQVRRPRDAMRRGIAYVPEDRKGQGLFLQLGALENLTINIAQDSARAGVLNGSRLRAEGEKAVGDFNVRLASLFAAVRELSGGNQQKILVARWLSIAPKLLILDEPTRGVDIAAKSEIYRLIDAFAARGMAVLVISSELPEIIALCDRVFVMREGRTVGMLDRAGAELTQEAIMAYATGVAEN